MDDCLIVGGGVIGLSLAYELAARGRTVRVIDRQEPGREASWAGAGILPPARRETATHPLDQLRGLSHALHPEWAARLQAETGIDTGYRRCGGIYLARTAGEAAALQAWAADLEELQIAAYRWDAAELARREPALTAEVRAAWWLPEEAQLRNPRHVQALATACRRRGVVVEAGVELLDCQLGPRHLERLRTSSGDRQARQICFTAGAWTYGLLSQLGVETGILPVRGQMVLFRLAKSPFRAVLNEGTRYLVPREDGRVLVGSTEEEVGFVKETTDEAIGELVRLAGELVPELRGAAIEQVWAGLRPGTFDGFPYLGRIPGLENAFVAAGHFRNGLHLSTGTAVVMRQLMEREAVEIDLSPFSVARGNVRPGVSAAAPVR